MRLGLGLGLGRSGFIKREPIVYTNLFITGVWTSDFIWAKNTTFNS